MERNQTLARQWNHRIATRGSLVVLLALVPVLAAGLISAGGGGAALFPSGFGALTSGPDEQATVGTLERPGVGQSPGAEASALLALVEKPKAKDKSPSGGGVTPTTPVTTPFAGGGAGTPPPDGGDGSAGGGGSGGSSGGSPQVPASSGVGSAVQNILNALLGQNK